MSGPKLSLETACTVGLGLPYAAAAATAKSEMISVLAPLRSATVIPPWFWLAAAYMCGTCSEQVGAWFVPNAEWLVSKACVVGPEKSRGSSRASAWLVPTLCVVGPEDRHNGIAGGSRHSAIQPENHFLSLYSTIPHREQLLVASIARYCPAACRICVF